MAASSGTEAPAISSSINPNAQETMPSSSPVEMSDLKASAAAEAQEQQDTTAGAEQPIPPSSTPPPPGTQQEREEAEEPSPPPKPDLTRTQTEALGPATDLPITTPPPSASGATLAITLMLTTGARHPYKIDEKYLTNRKVEAESTDGTFDPREISGYKLKELIWTDWRSEWEPRPASPSSIRLIILGRFVEDKCALKDFPFKLDDTNVVHMTVKPADFLDDDDTGGKKGHSMRGADREDGAAGCCRCVIL